MTWFMSDNLLASIGQLDKANQARLEGLKSEVGKIEKAKKVQ